MDSSSGLCQLDNVIISDKLQLSNGSVITTEQRKGRIQRIGQISDKIHIYNMRYKDSVEDKVHSVLSERLEDIFDMFGQIPDTLEDVWIDIALNNEAQAKERINAIPATNPFTLKYEAMPLKTEDWESC